MFKGPARDTNIINVANYSVNVQTQKFIKDTLIGATHSIFKSFAPLKNIHVIYHRKSNIFKGSFEVIEVSQTFKSDLGVNINILSLKENIVHEMAHAYFFKHLEIMFPEFTKINSLMKQYSLERYVNKNCCYSNEYKEVSLRYNQLLKFTMSYQELFADLSVALLFKDQNPYSNIFNSQDRLARSFLAKSKSEVTNSNYLVYTLLKPTRSIIGTKYFNSVIEANLEAKFLKIVFTAMTFELRKVFPESLTPGSPTSIKGAQLYDDYIFKSPDHMNTSLIKTLHLLSVSKKIPGNQ